MMRACTEADLCAILAIETASFSDPWSHGQFTTILALPYVRALVHEVAGEIVGYLLFAIVCGECEILNLAVAPAARGKGYAKTLLGALFAAGDAAGANTYLLEVREGNTAARALYTAHGFCEVGRRRNYYQNPREDAILMTKTTNEATDEHTQH